MNTRLDLAFASPTFPSLALSLYLLTDIVDMPDNEVTAPEEVECLGESRPVQCCVGFYILACILGARRDEPSYAFALFTGALHPYMGVREVPRKCSGKPFSGSSMPIRTSIDSPSFA